MVIGHTPEYHAIPPHEHCLSKLDIQKLAMTHFVDVDECSSDPVRVERALRLGGGVDGMMR